MKTRVPHHYCDTLSLTDRAAIRAKQRGELRPVSAQRARKLRKRGTRVFWSEFHNSYAWNPREPRR